MKVNVFTMFTGELSTAMVVNSKQPVILPCTCEFAPEICSVPKKYRVKPQDLCTLVPENLFPPCTGYPTVISRKTAWWPVIRIGVGFGDAEVQWRRVMLGSHDRMFKFKFKSFLLKWHMLNVIWHIHTTWQFSTQPLWAYKSHHKMCALMWQNSITIQKNYNNNASTCT